VSGCEAMVQVYTGAWTRCWDGPTERHHMLTRARGGRVLDAVGETYHLINLCHHHHRLSDGAVAYEAGLLIDGYAMREGNRVVYYGTDDYLSAKYPKEMQ
jgi:hypothetical protein